MEKELIIAGRKVSLKIRGNGKPVFFLHGWGGTKESWDKLIWEMEKSGIANDRTLIRFDFPGFGVSEEPDKAWGVTDYAHFTEKLIDDVYKELKLSGNYDLIVHSFGGRVLFKLFEPGFDHRISQKPDKLVLIAAAGIKPHKTLRIRVAAAAAKTGKKLLSLPGLRRLAPLAQKVLYKALKTHDYEKSSGVMRETFIKVYDEDLSGSISHVKNPTLIFWGRHDSYVPLSDGFAMNKAIPGSRIVTFHDGKHGIHKTHAGIMAPQIVEFLWN